MNEQTYFIMHLSFTIEQVKPEPNHYVIRVYNRVNKKVFECDYLGINKSAIKKMAYRKILKKLWNGEIK